MSLDPTLSRLFEEREEAVKSLINLTKELRAELESDDRGTAEVMLIWWSEEVERIDLAIEQHAAGEMERVDPAIGEEEAPQPPVGETEVEVKVER